MRRLSLALFASLLASLLWAAPVMAQTPPEEPLRIGTHQSPPFAMKSGDGSWSGISIEFLDLLATEMGVRVELVETDLEGMITGVAEGRLDASIAAITVTFEREKIVDFSYPYYLSGLGVAVASQPASSFGAILDAVTSRDFLVTIGVLVGLLAIVGSLQWLLERRANPGQFEPQAARGLFSGFWWAAVTMTTVGYGDKAPITFLGRLLGLLWMFSALILMALIVAQLTAAVTEHQIGDPFRDASDLTDTPVGYVEGAASISDIRAAGIRPLPSTGVVEGLEALRSGRIEAFVHDAPILIWAVAETDGVRMTPIRFAPQNYAIALPEGSPHREALNLAILEVLDSPIWQSILRRYLGTDE